MQTEILARPVQTDRHRNASKVPTPTHVSTLDVLLSGVIGIRSSYTFGARELKSGEESMFGSLPWMNPLGSRGEGSHATTSMEAK